MLAFGAREDGVLRSPADRGRSPRGGRVTVLRIGLTGGIACGKSEVARRFATAGLEILDLDRLAHGLMAPGLPAHADVVEAFGRGVLAPDGSIDRRALGAIVFASTEARERLDRLVHPRVREAEAQRAQALASRPGSVLVTDAALLVEAGMHLRFDRLVVVHCRPEQQVARLRSRDSLSEEQALARVAAQMPIETKRRFAHFHVDSSGTLSETEGQADTLAGTLVDLAGNRPPPIVLSRARVLGALLEGPSRGPRGLGPEKLAAHLVSHDGVELSALAQMMDPPIPRPWYQVGFAAPAESEAATLVVPPVLFDLARHGHDPERLAASAHSLAWLADPYPERVASAVLMALVMAEVAAAGRVAPDLENRSRPWRAVAARWGKGEAGPSVVAAMRAAVRHSRDAQAARAACAAAGVEPGLAGAIVGVAGGGRDEPATAWEPFLRGLGAPTG